MKIAILYVALGRYTVFWKDFYTSCQKFFIPEADREYYVFTDAEDLEFANNSNVHLIHQEKRGWPYDTLLRFDMFLGIEDKLKKADYIFFFNGNAKFLKKIAPKEMLPDDEHDGLVAATFDWTPDKFTYDRNPESLAYIPYGEGKYYFRGGVNGGKTEAYLKLIHTLSENTKKDLDKGVIAAWHDESHLNKYLLDKNPLILSHYYCFNRERLFNSPKVKIVMQDKTLYKFGGHKYLRGLTDKKISLPLYLFKRSLKQIHFLVPKKSWRKKIREYCNEI